MQIYLRCLWQWPGLCLSHSYGETIHSTSLKIRIECRLWVPWHYDTVSLFFARSLPLWQTRKNGCKPFCLCRSLGERKSANHQWYNHSSILVPDLQEPLLLVLPVCDSNIWVFLHWGIFFLSACLLIFYSCLHARECVEFHNFLYFIPCVPRAFVCSTSSSDLSRFCHQFLSYLVLWSSIVDGSFSHASTSLALCVWSSFFPFFHVSLLLVWIHHAYNPFTYSFLCVFSSELRQAHQNQRMKDKSVSIFIAGQPAYVQERPIYVSAAVENSLGKIVHHITHFFQNQPNACHTGIVDRAALLSAINMLWRHWWDLRMGGFSFLWVQDAVVYVVRLYNGEQAVYSMLASSD